MIILIIVGTVFSAFALMLTYIRLYYVGHAQTLFGRVVAIEKRVSKTNYSGRTRVSVVYSPIVEYAFKGENYWFRSYGASNALAKFRIGQKVGVLSLKDGPEYVMLKEGITKIMAFIFGILGLILLGIGLSKLGEVSLDTPFEILFNLAPLIFIVPTFITIGFKMRAYSKKHPELMGKMMLKSATLETKESLKDREVYFTQSEVDKQVSKNADVGVLISMIFFFGAFMGAQYCWNKLGSGVKEQLISMVEDFSRYNEFIGLINKSNPMVIGFLFSSVMALFGLYGLIISLKQRGR